MHLLEEHFEAAFDAPDGIKKLRELILTLAMQGKLVEQDPSDPPAIEVIKEVEAYKSRGVINKKNHKSILLIDSKEKPYETPDNWLWAYLGDIYSLEYGDNLPAEKRSNTGEYPVYGSNGIVGTHHQAMVNSSCIIIGRKGSAGALNLSLTNGCWVTDVAYYCIPPTGLDIYFTLNLFKTLNFTELGKGIKPGLSRTEVYALPIPIPPLPEQRRIVAKIDQLMARCDELEALRASREQKRQSVHISALNALLAATEPDAFARAWEFLVEHFSDLHRSPKDVAELRKAVLQLAVMGKLVQQDPEDPPIEALLREIEEEKSQMIKAGKLRPIKSLPPLTIEEQPYQVPKEWKWVRVCEIVEVGTGSTPSTTEPTYYGGNIPWYTSSSTNKPFADLPEKYITEKAIKETNCKIFPAGSLIIALYGQGKTRGQISEIKVPGATNQAIAALIFYKNSIDLKDFIKYYFIKIYEELRSIAEGAAQPNLNVGKIKETLIPLPPLAEQRRIINKIDQLMSLCDRLDEHLSTQTSKQSELLNAVMATVTPATAPASQRTLTRVKSIPATPDLEEDLQAQLDHKPLDLDTFTGSTPKRRGQPPKNAATSKAAIPTAANEAEAIRILEARKLERALGARQTSLFDVEE